ncbi:MAG: hypothetical protein IT336_03100 [Thermomicrobiales bacterium]|nr:hypothetical protein [Thermomicrobiales bacterium]
MNATLVRVLRVGLVVLLGLILGSAQSVNAAVDGSTASIEIHNRVCPVEYDGSDLFGDCHDNPVANLEFTVDGPVTATQTTNASGNTTFTGLPGGTYEISGGAPGDFAASYIYCSVVDDPDTVLVNKSALTVEIDLPADTAVVCDWYNIPYDLAGNGDDDTDGSPTLPSTGVAPVSGGTDWTWLLAAASGSAGIAFGLRRRAAC